MGTAKTPVVLFVGRAQLVDSLVLHYVFYLSEHFNSLIIFFNLKSFYEGHTMELVTFATRVCKLLGVETMIGALTMPVLVS
jgi:hypothetical protein